MTRSDIYIIMILILIISRYFYSAACGIEVPNSDELVITGGWDGMAVYSRVQVYTVEGAKERLPDMNQPRRNHACGYFYTGNNLVITL